MSAITEPLYVTGIGHDGKMLLGGIFRMHDQVGFPVDLCVLEAQQRGFLIDWMEALADCWLNDCLKFDSFLRQAEDACKVAIGDMFKKAGAKLLALHPKLKQSESPINAVCEMILASKKAA